MNFQKWVLDPNILISYCLSKKLHLLPALVHFHKLEFCASMHLLDEFTAVLSRERFAKYLTQEVGFYSNVISHFLSFYPIQQHYIGSPDIKDDYLIDIVLQTASIGLITGDKALLSWQNTPIQIISLNQFHQTYPL